MIDRCDFANCNGSFLPLSPSVLMHNLSVLISFMHPLVMNWHDFSFIGRDPVIDPKVNLSADPDHVLIHWLPPYPMDVPENTTWFNVKILTSSGVLVIDRNVTTNFIRIRKEHFEVGHKCNCTITTWNLAGKSEPITIVIPGPTPNTPMSTPMSSSSFIKDTNVDTSEISTLPIVIAGEKHVM